MDEKNPGPPPQYESANPQINTGYEPAPPYNPAAQNPQSPGYMQQPGVPGQAYGGTTAVVYQQPPPGNVMVTAVEDNMGLAIFATFCCFWPLGLVAIMRASESRSALALNDYARAQVLADESKRMSRYSIVIGAVLFVVLFVTILAINLSF